MRPPKLAGLTAHHSLTFLDPLEDHQCVCVLVRREIEREATCFAESLRSIMWLGQDISCDK